MVMLTSWVHGILPAWFSLPLYRGDFLLVRLEVLIHTIHTYNSNIHLEVRLEDNIEVRT